MRKYGIFVLITLFMFLPIKVNALTGSVSLSCSPNSVSAGGTAECVVSGVSDGNVKKITADIEHNDNFTVTGFVANEKWTKNGENNESINISTNEDISGNFELGKITVKVNDDATIESGKVILASILFYDSDNNEVSLSNASTTIEIGDENDDGGDEGENPPDEPEQPTGTGLESLTIENGTIESDFVTTVYEYIVTISSDTFGLNMKAVNSDDKISVVEGETESSLDANNITFKPNEQGLMFINIVVGTGDKAVKYVLLVEKEDSGVVEEPKNLLASLIVGGKTVDLKPGDLDYEVTLDSNIGYKVSATLSDPDNYVFDEFENGNGTFSGESFVIIIHPKDPLSGLKSVTYRVLIKQSKPSTGGSSATGGASSGSTTTNPETSDIPMFLMALVLIASLVISIALYKKNIDAYN